MKNKLLFVLAFVFLAMTLITLVTTAQTVQASQTSADIKDMKVYVRGDLAWSGQCTYNGGHDSSDPNTWSCPTGVQLFTPSLEEGENMDVKVVLTGGDNLTESIQNVIVRAWFRASGNTIEDDSSVFDVYKDNQYTKTLYLKVPTNINMDNKNTPKFYELHVDLEADDSLSGMTSADINFDVQRLSEDLTVKSINMRTSSCTEHCNTVYADVVVKNTGSHDISDIYVKGTIKELGLSTTEYIDELVAFKNNNNNDEYTSKQVTLAFQLPGNVQPGTYTLEIDVSGDGVSESTETQQFTLSGTQTTPTSVDVVPQVVSQDISEGGSATYSMIVTNQGTSTQTFTVETTGLDWATSQVTPATFSLAAGESKIVSIYVTAKSGIVSGDHLFSAKVMYGQESKTVNFTANVAEQSKTLDMKTILMIVGIVLAVAIIILLIVLLAQKTKTEEKAEESYY